MNAKRNTETELKRLVAENRQLRQENASLRQQLGLSDQRLGEETVDLHRKLTRDLH